MNYLVVRSTVLLCGFSAAIAAHAQAWPNKPIKFVVPFTAGGANDLMARAAAEGASKVLGQPVVIDNKPGAGGSLGAELVAKSPPDGYTFLISAAGVISNHMIKKSMPFKESDLVPVAMIALSPSIIVAPPNATYSNLKEFVEASKKSPDGFNFATAGTGSTPHFVAEILKSKYGAKLQVVPYKSGNESATAIMAGQVQATSEASIVSLPKITGGKMKALANTWTTRISSYSQLSTATEQGFPEVKIAHWAGVHAPAGVAAEIMDKVAAAVDAAMKTPEIANRLKASGIEPIGGTRASFNQFVAEEKARLAAVVKVSGMKED
ncbi:tripartite tricarboxylate transporter substrate binding protein [Casimicrobium huifangae]|uniref:tripartite tricarboxylate transporter substrate binding protein n=1 Tax=Casimicrobium huifangae TaxID=2591109 RepID=UPI0037852275